MNHDPAWSQYQALAAELLNRFASDFGLARVEGAQSIAGQTSGTSWAIDAKGVRDGEDGIVIVECRRYMSKRQTQEQIAALAYRIADTRATGAIIVSPLGLQLGAAKVAASANIVSVTLDPQSTATDFAMRFLNKIFVSLSESVTLTDDYISTVTRTCRTCLKQFVLKAAEEECPSCSRVA